MRLGLEDIGRNFRILSFILVVLSSVTVSPTIRSAWAEWTVEGQGYLFGTEDAALFSETCRLSKDQDPTQPVIDSKLADRAVMRC